MRSSVGGTTDFGSVGRRFESCRISEIIDFDMIGEKIKKRRMELGWSQKDLADKVGCTWQSVCRLETGKGYTSTLLEKITTIMGLKVDLLYDN